MNKYLYMYYYISFISGLPSGEKSARAGNILNKVLECKEDIYSFFMNVGNWR